MNPVTKVRLIDKPDQQEIYLGLVPEVSCAPLPMTHSDFLKVFLRNQLNRNIFYVVSQYREILTLIFDETRGLLSPKDSILSWL